MTNSHAFTHIHTDRYIATWLPSQQGDTSIMSHNYYLFFVVRTFMICSLAAFKYMIQQITPLRKHYQRHPSETQACCDFLGGPVVKTLCSNTGRMGSIPGWGTKLPHAV